jgi:hypothetical protein
MAEKMLSSDNFNSRMININIICEEEEEDNNSDLRATALFAPTGP